ncbi:MAG: hypothetical protein LBI05_02965, partial [Planctomycetaceae bacterium]|nr:hypothetical protein [Planctomycetaceae bacterium]
DEFYEVVDPVTQKTEFVTRDRFIAETHYEKGYTVYEKHQTVTKHSTFNHAIAYSILQWHGNPNQEENYNENDTDTGE